MKLRTLLCLAALAPAAFAQPSATMRPELLASFDLSYSKSSNEDIARGSTVLGQLSVEQYGFSASGRHPWSEQTVLAYGVAFETYDFQSSFGLPLPKDLTEFSLNLGVQHRINAQWGAAVYLRPGFYGDLDEGLNSKSLNAPFLAMATFAQSKDLMWSFGLNVNAFSDNPVLPIVGVRWKFAPDWTFSLGFPRSGFTWKFSDRLSFNTGASFSGGSFRLSQNLGVPATGIPRLANTFVDFREVRIGVGAEYAFTERSKLSVDVGAVTDRKIDYFDKNYRLDGDAGTFVSIAFKGGF